MKRLSMIALGIAVAATSARADVVLPSPRLQLTSLRLLGGDAPAPDRRRALDEARAVVHARTSRIRRCLDDVDLRRDPLQTTPRTLRGALVFDRSTRPRVRLDTHRGLSAAARSCVLRALRGVSIRTRPRGTAQIRFEYSVR